MEEMVTLVEGVEVDLLVEVVDKVVADSREMVVADSHPVVEEEAIRQGKAVIRVKRRKKKKKKGKQKWSKLFEASLIYSSFFPNKFDTSADIIRIIPGIYVLLFFFL